MQNSGTGRVFDNFSGEFVDRCRDKTRGVVASIHGVSVDCLKKMPEKASIKPEGCRALKWHLDAGRRGSVQVVIALTSTVFMVWPGSHKVPVIETNKYYELKAPIGKLKHCKYTLGFWARGLGNEGIANTHWDFWVRGCGSRPIWGM